MLSGLKIMFNSSIQIPIAIVVINIILGLEGFNSQADINSDGVINIIDVVQLVKLILN